MGAILVVMLIPITVFIVTYSVLSALLAFY